MHTPGHKMVQSNALSQWPDLCPEKNLDNEDMVMLPQEMFIKLIDMDLQDRIADSNNLDNMAAVEALKLLLEKAPTAMTTGLNDWKLETLNGQNILLYKGKNYICQNTDLQWDLVKYFHDHEMAGHPGEIGTYNYNTVWQHYWWPGLWTFH